MQYKKQPEIFEKTTDGKRLCLATLTSHDEQKYYLLFNSVPSSLRRVAVESSNERAIIINEQIKIKTLIWTFFIKKIFLHTHDVNQLCS